MFPHRLILLLALLAAPQSDTPTATYVHPAVDMQFTAAPGWHPVARPGDPGTSEWVDPAGAIHVLMWCTSTEQDARRYLGKMSHMMDLDLDAEPYPRRFGAHAGWVLDVPGRVEGRTVRTALVVVPAGRSALRPREHLLHVFQVHCAAADSARLRPALNRVLDGLRVTDQVMREGRYDRLGPGTLDSPYDVPSSRRAGGPDLLAERGAASDPDPLWEISRLEQARGNPVLRFE